MSDKLGNDFVHSSTNNTGPGNAGINLPLGTANFILSGMYNSLMGA